MELRVLLAVSGAGFAGIGVLAFIIYVFLLVYFGVRCFRNQHLLLFVLGFFFFPLWIVGGMMPPKGMSRIDAEYARKGRQS
jgi:hypothetical protein